MRFKLTSSRVRARPRRLKARWKVELDQELTALHSAGSERRLLRTINRKTTMREVKVSKSELLAIIKKNREEHRGLFLEAQTKFREAAIKVLDAMLKAARDGKQFEPGRLIELRAPQDHTSDYDRVIEMLKMSVEETIMVSDTEFQSFVQDQWDWSKNWALSNSGYVSRNSRFYGKLSAMSASED